MVTLKLVRRASGHEVLEAVKKAAANTGGEICLDHERGTCVSWNSLRGGNSGGTRLDLYVNGRFGYHLAPARNYKSLQCEAMFGDRTMVPINPASDSRYGPFVKEFNAAFG